MIQSWTAEDEDNQLEGRHDTRLDGDGKTRWVAYMAIQASKERDGLVAGVKGKPAVGNSEKIDGFPREELLHCRYLCPCRRL